PSPFPTRRSSELCRRPAWLGSPRGPDVSPDLRWYPVVTMLQLALDMALATSAPIGYGHVFAPQHYLDAWIAVTGADDWSAEDISALTRHLAQESRQAIDDRGDRDDSEEDAYDNGGG